MTHGRKKGVPEWLRFELVKAVCLGHVPLSVHSFVSQFVYSEFVDLETLKRVAKTLLSNRAQKVTSSQLI